MKIRIEKKNGERCVYQGEKLIANIYDNRRRIGQGNITDNWAVAWLTGATTSTAPMPKQEATH